MSSQRMPGEASMMSFARFPASSLSCPSQPSQGSLSLAASFLRAAGPARPLSTLGAGAFQLLGGVLRARRCAGAGAGTGRRGAGAG